VQAHGTRRGGAQRSLAPKEHGAYGQLGLPLFVGLALGTPHVLSWCVALASVLAFLAHEPLLLVLGQRGKAAQRTQAERARRKLFGLALVGLVTSGYVVLESSWSVRIALGVNAAAAAVALLFIVNRRERTTVGEIWIAGTLPSVVLPIGLLQGLSWNTVLAIYASFALAFAAGIVGVRAIISEFKTGKRWAGFAALTVLGALILALGALSVAAALSAASFWAAVCVLRLLRPSPRYLRQVGWTLVGASVVQTAWLWGAYV
jgi:uncharacterized protein YhhL (DUF1145 family)